MRSCIARILIAFAGLSASQCSHRVELYCDAETPCTDPERPFCDVQGQFPASEGIRNTCIPDPGGADAGPDATPAEPNVVFVTSTVHTGNLGGLAGADAICQQRAEAAGRAMAIAVFGTTTRCHSRP